MKHPKWCDYPVSGETIVDQCWGFIYEYVEKDGEDYCKTCEYYKPKSTIVQQSLSPSPKSPQDMFFGGWYLCQECKNCKDFAEECKNEKCEFYNERFDMNCDANEDFCEKCNLRKDIPLNQ